MPHRKKRKRKQGGGRPPALLTNQPTTHEDPREVSVSKPLDPPSPKSLPAPPLKISPALVGILKRDFRFWLPFTVSIAAVLFTGWNSLLTRQNMQVSQRAWVGVNSIKTAHPAEVGKPLTFVIEMLDTGPSPALDTEMTRAIVVDEKSLDQIDLEADFRANTSSEGPPVRSVLFPNHPVTFAVGTRGPVNEDFLNGLETGRYHLFVMLTANYKDIFGCRHHTDYCEAFDPHGPNGPALTVCSKHVFVS